MSAAQAHLTMARRDASFGLDDPKIATTLQKLHARAKGDVWVFLRALPGVAGALLRGRPAIEGALPYLKDAYIPVDPNQGRLLYLTARAIGARTMVEFGTSFGISTIYLAAAVRDRGAGRVITTELHTGKANRAREHLREAGLLDSVEIRIGDALETLEDLSRDVSLVFLDGWKNLYLPCLKLLEPKLLPGALIVADDIDLFPDPLRPYLDYVRATSGGYVSVKVPIGDALELSVRAP